MKLEYSKSQKIVLIVLRIVIGYHFLYAGLSKFYMPDWNAAPFLLQANWLFSEFFHFLANNGTVLAIVNVLNIWGQIFIGISLITGLFSRLAAIFGAIMIAFFYIAVPPFLNNEFFVDKNLLEFIGFLLIVSFPTSNIFGLDILVQKYKSIKE